MPDQPQQTPDFSVTTTPLDGVVDMSKPSQPKVDWTALAMQALQAAHAQAPGLTGFAVRAVPSIAGGVIGALGGPVGSAAGAATGATFGSEIAQTLETRAGQRPGVNPLTMVAEGLSAMVPMTALRPTALLPQIPKLAASAAGGSAVGSVGVQLADTGTIDPMRTLQETAAGTVLGTAIPAGVRGVQQLPKAATRVAQSPAVQKLVTNEVGAVGPQPPKLLTQPPDTPSTGGTVQTRPAAVAELPAAPPDVDATDAQWSRIAGEKLPAATRGVIDPVPVPSSMTPAGLPPASIKSNTERTLRFFDRHNLTPELKQGAVDILTKGEDFLFQQQRRSGQTWEQLDALASQIIPEVKLPKGSIVSPEETAALRRAAFGLLDRAQTISDDLKGIDAIEAGMAAGRPEGLAAAQGLFEKYGVTSLGQLRVLEKEAVEEAITAQRSLMGVRSEFGRGLNYLKSLQDRRNMDDADFLQAALKGGAVPQDAIAALRVMKTPLERYKFLRGLGKPGAQDYWRWYAMTAYLSGPVTQWRNFAGNASNFGIESVVVQPIAAGLDAVRNPNNRQVLLTENNAAAAGLASGFLDGVGKGLFYFKNGFSTDDVAAFEELPPEVFGGALAPNVIGRTMGAVDQFFRTVGLHMELHREATLQATKEGLSGEALSARIKQLVDDPTITPEIHKRARRYAAELTYQERNRDDVGGPLISGARSVMTGLDQGTKNVANFAWDHGLHKLGKMGSLTYGALSFPPSVLIAPFINTPFNILKRTGQYAFGATQMAKGGDRDAMINAARGAVGIAAMGTAAGLYLQGRITGTAPSDPAQRDAFYAQGKRPYAVKIGDEWVPYQYLGQVGMLLGAVSNYMQAAEQNPKDALGKFGTLVSSTAKMTVDNSFLKGMYTTLDAIVNGDRGDTGEKWAARTVTSLLPAAAAQRFVRDTIDPTLRNPEGMGEQIMAATPGLSDDVAPRLDYTGKEIARPKAVLPTDAKDAPLQTELARLKLQTGAGYLRDPLSAAKGLQTKINSRLKKLGQPAREVPREVQIRYGKKYGRVSATVLGQLIATPAYQRADDEGKRTMIERAKNMITEQVDAAFIRDYLRGRQ